MLEAQTTPKIIDLKPGSLIDGVYKNNGTLIYKLDTINGETIFDAEIERKISHLVKSCFIGQNKDFEKLASNTKFISYISRIIKLYPQFLEFKIEQVQGPKTDFLGNTSYAEDSIPESYRILFEHIISKFFSQNPDLKISLLTTDVFDEITALRWREGQLRGYQEFVSESYIRIANGEKYISIEDDIKMAREERLKEVLSPKIVKTDWTAVKLIQDFERRLVIENLQNSGIKKIKISNQTPRRAPDLK
jgi:hypothetical protein